MSTADTAAPGRWDQLRRLALLAGLVGLALSGLGWFLNSPQFFRSYLTAYLYWFGIGFGSLGLLLLHHVAYGIWGYSIRRELEAAALTLPVLAVLFLPILLGLHTHQLYPWSDPEVVAHNPLLQHKSAYLNVNGFTLRAVLYFVIWSGFAFLLNRWSYSRAQDGTPTFSNRLGSISAPGVVLFILSGSFAMIDWVMSLEPEWYSSIYGVMLMIGQVLSAMAFMIVVSVRLSGPAPLTPVSSTQQVNDHGNLLLAFVMLWTYFSFSQFLIIWAGNLGEEIPWYLRRMRHGWQYLAILIISAQFWLPFLILLVRENKRSPRVLSRVAALILVIHLVEVFWLVAPAPPVGAPQHASNTEHPGESAMEDAAHSDAAGSHGSSELPAIRLGVHWLLDPATVVGIGGIWVAAFLWFLKDKPVVPRRELRQEDDHGHGHGHGHEGVA